MNQNSYKIINADFNPEIYDAIIVPGVGGPRNKNEIITSLPEWVVNKLDCVVKSYRNQLSDTPIVLLSAGTYHKAAVLDVNGRNVAESTAMALYLETKYINMDNVYIENLSYDTIGNAFFLRTIHTDVKEWKKLLIVVNEFHFERCKFIFDWVFSLKTNNHSHNYTLNYWIIYDTYDHPIIKSRKEREQASLNKIMDKINELDITQLSELHYWLFHEHDLYSSSNKKNLLLKQQISDLDKNCLDSY